MAQASKMNRGYSGGLAAGAPAGGSFRSSFQSSYTPPPPMQPAQQQPQQPGMQPTPDLMPAPAQPPPVDFSNMFGSQPLPAPGQQSYNQPPPSPFGPAPLPFGGYRQRGGPVMPGQAYIVGEAGPEMIVPQQPGMVLPNQTLTGRASAQDGAVRSGPLSSRGATPVGSGRGMTPERRLEIAARRGDPRANLALFNADQWGRNSRAAGRGLPPMPMPMGRAPLPPSAARLMPNFPPRPENLMGQDPAQPAPAAPGFDLTNMLPPLPMAQAPGGAFDPQAPLPPSTFMGGAGVPPPPRFSEVQAGGMNLIVDNDTGKQVAAYKDTPAPSLRQQPPTAAAFGQARAAGFEPFQVDGNWADENGIYYLNPLPPAPQPTERVTERDKATGTTRTYTQPRGAAPAAADPQAAPVQEMTTPGGVKVKVRSATPTAAMQTGQMPNEAFANPLSPEQSLEAARAEYLRTGDDAALRKHFQQFPSASTRLANQEAKVWGEIGQNIGNYQQELIGVANARQDRDRFINANAMGPLGAGAAAVDYGRMQPAMNRRAARDLPPLDLSLIEQANNLNKIAQARRAMNLR